MPSRKQQTYNHQETLEENKFREKCKAISWWAADVALVMSADVFVCVVGGLSPRSVNLSMSKTVSVKSAR